MSGADKHRLVLTPVVDGRADKTKQWACVLGGRTGNYTCIPRWTTQARGQKKCQDRGLNTGPSESRAKSFQLERLQSAALPTELSRR